jgi:hypothetical protein
MVELIDNNDLTKNRLCSFRDDLLRILRKLGINDGVTYDFIRYDFVEDSNDYKKLALNLQLIGCSVLTHICQNTI